MKIVLLPFDKRPVCYDLPQYCAKIDDTVSLILPDENLLSGKFEEGLFDFLSEQKDADCFIISADLLLYGGLISSRRCKETFTRIKSRLTKLQNFIEKINAKVFLFSSIMRISDNYCNEEEKDYWKDFGREIFGYSYLSHKSEVEKEKYELPEVPAGILKDYLETRKRNFEINLLLGDLAHNEIKIVFCKDDCAKFGFNVKEAEILKEKFKNNLAVSVVTGADEIALNLLSNCLAGEKKIKIAPIYSHPESTNKISRYEDISVKESVISQIIRSGGVLCDITENPDLIMFVNNFKDEQGELVFDIRNDCFEGNLPNFDRPFFIADISNANGSDNKLIGKLFETDILKSDKFFGYAGWNTTSNTCGSAICAAVSKFCAKKYNDKTFKELQTIRFLDDWAYQSNIRKTGQPLPSKEELKKLFEPYETKIKKIFASCSEYSYDFPLNRTFEIKIC